MFCVLIVCLFCFLGVWLFWFESFVFRFIFCQVIFISKVYYFMKCACLLVSKCSLGCVCAV